MSNDAQTGVSYVNTTESPYAYHVPSNAFVGSEDEWEYEYSTTDIDVRYSTISS